MARSKIFLELGRACWPMPAWRFRSGRRSDPMPPGHRDDRRFSQARHQPQSPTTRDSGLGRRPVSCRDSRRSCATVCSPWEECASSSGVRTQCLSRGMKTFQSVAVSSSNHASRCVGSCSQNHPPSSWSFPLRTNRRRPSTKCLRKLCPNWTLSTRNGFRRRGCVGWRLWIHRRESSEGPPPGTKAWMCGWWPSRWFQVFGHALDIRVESSLVRRHGSLLFAS